MATRAGGANARGPASPGRDASSWWWQPFRTYWVSGSLWGFEFGNAYNSGYLVAGTPTVTYKGNASSTCAWVFAWHTAGDTYYTRCKAASETAALTPGTETSHRPAVGKSVWSPALGSAQAYAEILDVWR